MFRRLQEADGPPVRFTINGHSVLGRQGDTVAAALLCAGSSIFRTTPASSAPRGPYCLMGVCFECLVSIDGVGNRQSCMVALTEGMAIETQLGPRSLSVEMRMREDQS